MASGSADPPYTVNFPVSESPQKQPKPGSSSSPLKAPHLPFRRISLPTAPSLLHRVSVVSVASFDSFPEDDEGVGRGRGVGLGDHNGSPVPQSNLRTPTRIGAQGRPMSAAVESPRRRNRPRRESSVKPPAVDLILAAKRRKVVDEFYETEKAYVDGLELIYSHFLTPIIASLDTTEPLLNRSALTSVFSNFIDIWNLHRSFLSALTSVLEPSAVQNQPPTPSSSPSKQFTSDNNTIAPPTLSPLLLAHFPYLSLYTPFVTAFPSTISAINELITPPASSASSSSSSSSASALRPTQYNPRFAAFLSTQEADSRCGKLKLRDWLLTIVQRCPRYLLLLKDLINSTGKEDPEHAQLTAVHTLVAKITLSLNTSLHTHAQTLSLLALQKSTPNLPFQLISPGRTLLKRGPLLQVERSGDPVEREFLLFSDCMIWLAPVESSSGLGGRWEWSWSGSGSGSGVGSQSQSQSSHNTPVASSKRASAVPVAGVMERPPMMRSRSKSEAELSTLKMGADPPPPPAATALAAGSPPPSPSARPSASASTSASASASTSTPVTPPRRPRPQPPPPPNMAKRHPSSDDRWTYKGRVELVDVQVVVGHAHALAMAVGTDDEGTRRVGLNFNFEVLSPEGSFVLYASSEQERDDWTSEIRSAKAQLLVSLNVTNPNSTLTSSASTNHVRRALQALPYPPSDERLATLRVSGSGNVDGAGVSASASGKVKTGKKDKGKEKAKDKETGKKDKDKEKTKSKGTPKPNPKRGVSAERRGKVEHWVPAIWIPDGKTASCMRCGRMFGWRRRRHHCRLCGRCVCAGCSGRTFFVTDANSKSDSASKPARACDACYETVFPLIDTPDSSTDHEHEHEHEHYATSASASTSAEAEAANTELRGSDTITSLSHLPSWLSMPVLPVQRTPQALMAIGLNSHSNSSRDLRLAAAVDRDGGDMGGGGSGNGEERDRDREKGARMRVKSHQRLRSYQQILEDFQEQARAMKKQQQGDGDDDAVADDGEEQQDTFDADEDDEEDEDEDEDQDQLEDVDVWSTPTHSAVSSPLSSPRKQRHPQLPQRREDTARRSKRFSLPAIALQTTSVTARTVELGAEGGGGGGLNRSSGASAGTSASNGAGGSNAALSRESSAGAGAGAGAGDQLSGGGVGRSRRFSLVLAGRNSYYTDGVIGKAAGGEDVGGGGDLARGVAAARLSELLGRKTSAHGGRA